MKLWTHTKKYTSSNLVFCTLFKFFYCCSITVVPISPHYPTLPYPPPPPTFNPLPSLSLSMGPLYMFLDLTLPLLSPVISLPPPLWSLSVCSLFPCLWFYFSLFVLLIRFHLQVKSYGICLSPPGLFHLA